MFPYERYNLIINAIRESTFMTIDELLKLTGSSLTTLRNDINYLSVKNKIRKMRGGIEYVEESTSFPYQNRKQYMEEEKEEIGIAAQDFIKDGDIIIITNGTTTSKVAKYINKNKHITVLTNGIDIVLELKEKPNINVILLGGIVDYTSFIVIGPTVLKMLEGFNPSKIIMGAGGITEKKGITVYDLITATYYPKMLEMVNERIVVADHSKINRCELAQIATLDQIDVIITDDGLPEKFKEIFNKHKIHYVIAKK